MLQASAVLNVALYSSAGEKEISKRTPRWHCFVPLALHNLLRFRLQKHVPSAQRGLE